MAGTADRMAHRNSGRAIASVESSLRWQFENHKCAWNKRAQKDTDVYFACTARPWVNTTVPPLS